MTKIRGVNNTNESCHIPVEGEANARIIPEKKQQIIELNNMLMQRF